MVLMTGLCRAAQPEAPAGSQVVITNEPILRLESLKIGSVTYSNVQVTARTETDVFIRHRKGIANFKVEDVPREVLVELGYKINKPEPTAAAQPLQLETKVTTGLSNTLAAAQKNQLLLHWVKKVRARITATRDGHAGTNVVDGAAEGEAGDQEDAEQLPDWGQLTTRVPQLALIVFSVLVVTVPLSYFFFCYTAKLICQKAGAKPGALIWLPIVSVFPLLRAARLPGWSAAIFLVTPLVSLVSQNQWAALGASVLVLLFMVVWSFRIVHARGKGILTALCLIFPVTSPMAWLYLAYSK